MKNTIKEKFNEEIKDYTNINNLNYKKYIERIRQEIINSNFKNEYELFKSIYKIYMFGINRFKLIKNENNSNFYEYLKEKLNNVGYIEENKINFKDVVDIKYFKGGEIDFFPLKEAVCRNEILNNIIGIVLKEILDNPIQQMSSIRRQKDFYYKQYILKEAELFLNLY